MSQEKRADSADADEGPYLLTASNIVNTVIRTKAVMDNVEYAEAVMNNAIRVAKDVADANAIACGSKSPQEEASAPAFSLEFEHSCGDSSVYSGHESVSEPSTPVIDWDCHFPSRFCSPIPEEAEEECDVGLVAGSRAPSTDSELSDYESMSEPASPGNEPTPQYQAERVSNSSTPQYKAEYMSEPPTPIVAYIPQYQGEHVSEPVIADTHQHQADCVSEPPTPQHHAEYAPESSAPAATDTLQHQGEHVPEPSTPVAADIPQHKGKHKSEILTPALTLIPEHQGEDMPESPTPKDDSAPEHDELRCRSCGKPYDTKVGLKQHIMDVHVGTRCYWPGCGTTVATEDELKRHFRNHQRDAIYGGFLETQCPWPHCGKDFSRTDTVQRCLKRHNQRAPRGI